MTKKKTKAHKTHATHKAHAKQHDSEKKEEHVSDKVSTSPMAGNIALIAVVFLVVGLLVGALVSYGAFMMNAPVEPVITDGDGVNLAASPVDTEALKLKVESYVNTNMLPPEVTFTALDVNEQEDGIFEISYTISQGGEVVEEGVIHSTRSKLIVGAVVNLDEEIEVPEPVGPEPPVTVSQTDVPEVELFVWGYCPGGIATLDIFAEAALKLQNVAKIKIVPFHTGHGAFETQENKVMLAIQELYPEKTWDYAVDFYDDVYPICSVEKTVECDTRESTKLMEKVGIDANAVFAMVKEQGDLLFNGAQARAGELGIGVSPSMVINGTNLGSSFNKNPESIKQLICTAFTNAPEECIVKLSDETSQATGSC